MKKNRYTQQDIDNRKYDYVCFDCGPQFLTEEQKKRETIVTAHMSECGLCGEEKSVTSIRKWNYLRLPKEHIKISEILKIQARINEINNMDLNNIAFIDDDNKFVKIDQGIIDEFKFVGLNNFEFITTDFYKNGFEE